MIGIIDYSYYEAPPVGTYPVRMDFEGLTQSVSGTRDDVFVSDYYNGGSSKNYYNGTPVITGPTPGIGAVFDLTAEVTESSTNGGWTSVVGSTRNVKLSNGTILTNDTTLGYAFLLTQTDAITLTFSAGFKNAVSFFYNTASPMTIDVYNMSGTWIGGNDFPSVDLYPSSTPRKNWWAAYVTFSGIAKTVIFTGATYDLGLDNITLGQIDPYGPLVPYY